MNIYLSNYKIKNIERLNDVFKKEGFEFHFENEFLRFEINCEKKNENKLKEYIAKLELPDVYHFDENHCSCSVCNVPILKRIEILELEVKCLNDVYELMKETVFFRKTKSFNFTKSAIKESLKSMESDLDALKKIATWK